MKRLSLFSSCIMQELQEDQQLQPLLRRLCIQFLQMLTGMDQLLQHLFQKKVLQREERLKTLIKLVDKHVVRKLFHLKRQAFFNLKNSPAARISKTRQSNELEREIIKPELVAFSFQKVKDELRLMDNCCRVQEEIIKKERICRMVDLVNEKYYSTICGTFCMLRTKKPKIRSLRVLLFSVHRQHRLREVLGRFEALRRFSLLAKQKRELKISFICHRVSLRQKQCFYQWRQAVSREREPFQVQARMEDWRNHEQSSKIAHAVKLYAALQRLRFKRLSESYNWLLVSKRGQQHIAVLNHLYFLLQCKQARQVHGALSLLRSQVNNCSNAQEATIHMIRNQSIIGGWLNNSLNIACFKAQKSKRNFRLSLLLTRLFENRRYHLGKRFKQWVVEKLPQYNFMKRLKLIHKNQKLEEDQKQLIEQYKQVQNENAKLQLAGYQYTPSEQSIRKSDYQGQQLQAFDEECEDYSYQYVENMESQINELMQKIQAQEEQLEEQRLSFELQKNELLQLKASKEKSVSKIVQT